MPELDLVVTVTRSGLIPPLGQLDINDGTNYVFTRGFEVGAVSWRKEAATSPYVHGRVVVHEVKDAVESRLGVMVRGTSAEEVDQNLETLLQAFTQQYNYELRVTVDGQDYHWRCERADYNVGFMTEFLAARALPVALTFMRHPIQVQGAF
jgi:hypothetical protein